MSFSYREERRGEEVLDVLTNEERGIRIIVARNGAEMISFGLRAGSSRWNGFLHRDDDLSPPASGWASHATVMGYFLHRLKDGRSLYRGQEIVGGTHSFLRTKTWHFDGADVATGGLTYRIAREDFTASEYPLNVSVALTYQFEDERVRVTFRFENHEPELTAHVGFGLHPGFAATDLESMSFKMPPGLYRRHFSPTNYLSGETEDIDFAGGSMPFPVAELRGSFILELVDVPERMFKFGDRVSGRAVEIDLTGVPYLTLWSDAGNFLCIEPCWGLTDHDQQRAFEDKEGIQTIAPGGQIEGSFAMTLRQAMAAVEES